MTTLADACRASARQCADIADHAPTFEDRAEFLDFAASWQKLAGEIESNERLIAFLDELASDAGGERESKTSTESRARSSLRHLVAAVAAASNGYLVGLADLSAKSK